MLTRAEMEATLAPRRAPPYVRRVGFEYEVICVDAGDLSPLRPGGPRGLHALLAEVATLLGGEPPAGESKSRAPLPSGACLSLEPGGQLEYSSAPVAAFRDVVAERDRFVGAVAEACARLRLRPFYGGANPVHTVAEIGLNLTSDRYRLMDAYYARIGPMGRRMMRQTCSLQVTFDFAGPEEAAELMRAALYASPFVAGLFSCSPYIDGAPTGYRSYRVPIWAGSDPARAGLVPGFGRPGFGVPDYLDHLLRAPMMFVRSDGRLVDAAGMTFDRFNREGFGGRPADERDLLLHASTMFTDVRLKQTLEVRSVDGQDPRLVPAVVALLAGLLLCPDARRRTLARLGSRPEAACFGLPDRLARQGLRAEVDGAPAAEIAAALIEDARGGVAACFDDADAAGAALDDAAALAAAATTPADLVRARFAEPRAWLAAGRLFPSGALDL